MTFETKSSREDDLGQPQAAPEWRATRDVASKSSLTEEVSETRPKSSKAVSEK